MNERPLFEGIDELERTYAPQELSPDDPERMRARLDDEVDSADGSDRNLPPSAAPVANLGNAPSAAAAPPNIGNEDHGGASGDPETQARNPLDTDNDPDTY